jgi:dihydrofolate synthase/folylpolyglutamate synthase
MQRLFQVNLFGGTKLGLKNCEQLQSLLNFPDRTYATIHVSGTNGKGSVTTKIAFALQAAGYKVGLYTSPHIACFRERIRINGNMIPEHAVEELLTKLFTLIEKEAIPATFFEITTFLAFLYFAQEKIDVAVLETGLGGRMDATNVVMPLLSIITSISLDHTEILGTTLEAIAKEKAGIIKPGVAVILGPEVPLQPIKAIAQGSPYLQLTKRTANFEEENQLIAKAALDNLSAHFKLTEAAILQGLETRPPCRFEIFSGPCPIILDVAHNPDGLLHLFQAVKQRYGNAPLRILFGLSKNKDMPTCLKILKEHGQAFHLVEAPNGRGISASELENELCLLGVEAQKIWMHPSILQGMRVAIDEANANKEVIIVCGSFFIMGEVRQALGLQEPQDSWDMNERASKEKM